MVILAGGCDMLALHITSLVAGVGALWGSLRGACGSMMVQVACMVLSGPMSTRDGVFVAGSGGETVRAGSVAMGSIGMVSVGVMQMGGGLCGTGLVGAMLTSAVGLGPLGADCGLLCVTRLRPKVSSTSLAQLNHMGSCGVTLIVEGVGADWGVPFGIGDGRGGEQDTGIMFWDSLVQGNGHHSPACCSPSLSTPSDPHSLLLHCTVLSIMFHALEFGLASSWAGMGIGAMAEAVKVVDLTSG